ncbi:MAG: protein-methionine-sulfoxide reductase heme-binding subunit MsrQ, partial [Candidatus Hydrogenedentota bacterium]
RLRKMLGLYGFFYACLHLLTYVALDQVFDLPVIVEDVFSRPFIIIGFLAFCMLVPLAVTSTSGWVRRLGKRWQKLHKLAYVIVILGAVHFFMRMKSDVTQPVVYGSAVAVLLGTRIMVAVRKQKKS